MIVAIGIDVCRSDRIAAAYKKFGARFANKILSEHELLRFAQIVHPTRKVAFLAKRFAAKEAVSKALGTGMRHGVHWRQIATTNTPSGEPRVVLSGAAFHRAAQLHVSKIHISLTDEVDMACVVAILETATPRCESLDAANLA